MVGKGWHSNFRFFLETLSKKHSMAKRFYGTTDETRTVLIGHEQQIAKAKGCDPSYIYNIKNSEEPDPFPPFREWFQHCATGGGPAHVYLDDLAAVLCRTHHGNITDCHTETLISKLNTDAETSQTLVAANADDHWDDSECDEILAACARMDKETERIRQLALKRKTKLNVHTNGNGHRETSKQAVGTYRQKSERRG